MTETICLFHTRALIAQNDLELVLLGEKTLNFCASSLVLHNHMFLFIRAGNQTHGLVQAKQALHS